MHFVLSLALAAAPTPSLPAKEDVDPAKLTLLADGKDRFIALDKEAGYKGPAFVGDGKTFFKVRSFGGGSQGTEQFSMALWDPRIDRGRYGAPSFDFKDGKFSVTCGPKTRELTVVPEGEAKPVLSSAGFHVPSWQRRPYRLARDDQGTYYFVDCFRDESQQSCRGDGRDWRLFVGPRGKLKLQPMKNVVSDSVGEIFATTTGEMRLVLDDGAGKQTFKWVQAKKEKPLTDVPVDDNAVMIYGSLGVYDREKLGTPCD